VKIVKIGSVSIGVFNVDGEYFAVRNVCPHRAAPLCAGEVGGMMLPSEPGDYQYDVQQRVVRCPWHRWPFDLRTGRSMVDPTVKGVKTYKVHATSDMIELELRARVGTRIQDRAKAEG